MLSVDKPWSRETNKRSTSWVEVSLNCPQTITNDYCRLSTVQPKMMNIDFYSIFYDIIAYIIAARSLIDEILYKLGYKRRINIEKDLPRSLEGHVAIVTGGTRGLGLTVVKELIAKGCLVVVASSQHPDNFSDLIQRIYSGVPEKDGLTNIPRGPVILHRLDLSDMYSVQSLVNSFKESKLRLNYLICNAGIMFAPKDITVDGIESHFAVNYLGHCILIINLLKIMRETALETKTDCRVISVSSSTHRATKFKFDDPFSEKYYSSSQAYAQSKLAQIMFSAKLSRVIQNRFNWDNVRTFSLHPGVILSDLYEHVRLIKYFPFLIPLIKCVTRTMYEGAETTLYAALSPELDGLSGLYLEDCAIKKPSRYAQDESEQDRLWEFTEKLLRRYFDPNFNEFSGVTNRIDGEEWDLAEWHKYDKFLKHRPLAEPRQVQKDGDRSSSLGITSAHKKFLLKTV